MNTNSSIMEIYIERTWAYTISGSMDLYHCWLHGPTPFLVPWAYTISGSMCLYHFWFHGPIPFLVLWFALTEANRGSRSVK